MRTGIVRSARNTPPGPNVSPTHCSTPYPRDLDIEFVGVQSALLKGGDDIVRMLDGFFRSVVASIFGGSARRSTIDWTIWRLFEPFRIDIHQADRAPLQTRRQQNVAAEVSGEYQASGTDKVIFRILGTP